MRICNKDLILNSVNCCVVGVTHLFEGKTENACKLGGNVSVYDQLTVSKTDVAKLIKHVRKLCGGFADKVYTGSENKLEGDFLGYDFRIVSLTLIVGDCEARLKQLAGVINVCKLLQGRKHIFKSSKQFLGIQLDGIVIGVLNGNCITVDLDFGDSGCNGVVDTDNSEEISLKIELIDKGLSNAGLVNNLYKLLVVNLGNKCTNTNSLNSRKKTLNINNVGDLIIHDDALCNACNATDTENITDVILNGYVFDECFVTAESFNYCIQTQCLVCKDGINNCSVINIAFSILLKAIENSVGCDLVGSIILSLKACLDLSFDKAHICKIVISAVIRSSEKIVDQLIYRNNVAVNKIVEADNCRLFITLGGYQCFNIEYTTSGETTKVFKEGLIAKNHRVNVEYTLIQKVTVPIFEKTVGKHRLYLGGVILKVIICAILFWGNNEVARFESTFNDVLCFFKVNNVTLEFFGNTVAGKQRGKVSVINFRKDLVQESVFFALSIHKVCQCTHTG